MVHLLQRMKERPAWAMAFGLSLLYGVVFFYAASGGYETGLLYGFCVAGHPGMPSKSEGCSNARVNSHIIAFGVDLAMGGIAVPVLCWRDRAKSGTGPYWSNGFIILSHGFLHFFLQLENGFNCYDPDVSGGMKALGNALLVAFSLALALLILKDGFGLSWYTGIGSVFFAASVLAICTKTGGGGEEFALPALFCVSHPLSSFTGLFSEAPPLAQPWVARFFLICTVVGVLELSACPLFFRAVGGHFWYDLTLHAAALASLPYFRPQKSKAS